MPEVLEMPVENVELSESEKLTKSQLKAVKNRAIALWGEKRWLIQLCYEYAAALGLENKRAKTSTVQRWFTGEHAPNLENFNTLLLTVGCKIQIEYTEVKKIL